MDPLSRGEGALFSDPSSERARAFFATKSRAAEDKLTTVADAVRRFVHDGDYLAVGGFGCVRIPTAVVHEILRQGRQELRFAGHTATHDFQILCAGCLMGRGKTLAKVDAAYVVGLEARGLSPHARRVMESGEVAFTEWTNFTLAVRFKAAAMGVPFLPVRSLLGTDTFRHSAACVITCPFTGEKLAAVPALYPDVAAIHVTEADRSGNCRIVGTSVADLDVARAAKRLIITCERLVSEDEIRRDPTRTVIPFFLRRCRVRGSVRELSGQHAGRILLRRGSPAPWLEIEADREAYRAWLEKYIYGVSDFAEYLNLCGGLLRMQELRRQELLLDRGR